ncbi:hypothetical protein DRJ25_04065 [Candidatus Woesearchaeota archaeon]|nr:MAG: hypothetical protein DRJ25_04065 [Candidatus Woesearchaeota archaeon]
MTNLNHEEINYSFGDEKKFLDYLYNIKNDKLKKTLFLSRRSLKQNLGFLCEYAFNVLENFTKDFLEDKVQLRAEDKLEWEMLGRAYEAILRVYEKNNIEGVKKIKNLSQKRAIASYINAGKIERAVRLKERFSEAENYNGMYFDNKEILEIVLKSKGITFSFDK